MKTQFMLIALGIIAVMAVPGAFAEQQDYELDLVIGLGDAERFLNGTITRTSVDDSAEIWSGDFAITGKNAQTYNITYLKVDFDFDGNPDGIYIVGESDHKWDRLLDIHMTPVGDDDFIVTGGFVIVADAYGNESVEPEKIIPIQSGTISEIIKEEPTKQFHSLFPINDVPNIAIIVKTNFTLVDNTEFVLSLINSNNESIVTINHTFDSSVTQSIDSVSISDLPASDYFFRATLSDEDGKVHKKSVTFTIW